LQLKYSHCAMIFERWKCCCSCWYLYCFFFSSFTGKCSRTGPKLIIAS